MSLKQQIAQVKSELDHLGSCCASTQNKAMLADLDNKFFDAMDRLKELRQKKALMAKA